MAPNEQDGEVVTLWAYVPEVIRLNLGREVEGFQRFFCSSREISTASFNIISNSPVGLPLEAI
jgi:hypothetical protein